MKWSQEIIHDRINPPVQRSRSGVLSNLWQTRGFKTCCQHRANDVPTLSVRCIHMRTCSRDGRLSQVCFIEQVLMMEMSVIDASGSSRERPGLFWGSTKYVNHVIRCHQLKVCFFADDAVLFPDPSSSFNTSLQLLTLQMSLELACEIDRWDGLICFWQWNMAFFSARWQHVYLLLKG